MRAYQLNVVRVLGDLSSAATTVSVFQALQGGVVVLKQLAAAVPLEAVDQLMSDTEEMSVYQQQARAPARGVCWRRSVSLRCMLCLRWQVSAALGAQLSEEQVRAAEAELEALQAETATPPPADARLSQLPVAPTAPPRARAETGGQAAAAAAAAAEGGGRSAVREQLLA